MKKLRPSRPAAKVPVLEHSPFEAEVVDKDDLSEVDRSYLQERETVIEAGQRTFLDVGRALLEIKNYQHGRLYKRYGTFEAYCQERWEFGRSYASRVMDATQVYQEMLPRGNKTPDLTVLPTTEKQLRSLTKLPAGMRAQAWNNAVETARGGPVLARLVEKEVRKAMAEAGGVVAKTKTKRRPLPKPGLQISRKILERIQAELASIKGWAGEHPKVAKIQEALQRIESLLPS
jgi:hypothetical protein